MNGKGNNGTVDADRLLISVSASPGYVKNSSMKNPGPGADVGLCEIELPIPDTLTREKHAVDGEAAPSAVSVPQRRGAKRPNEEPLYEYDPKLPLVSHVAVFPWGTMYSYYDSFLAAAERLRDLDSDENSYIPFFSYMPQYSQMNSHQLGYYLRLRSEIRNGRYPTADSGYLMLLVYELINLSGIYDGRDRGIAPGPALDMLAGIWNAYRNSIPRFDDQLSEWICDFCLIHRLSPPTEKLSSGAEKALAAASFREFYLRPDSGGDSYVSFLLGFVSGYDYKKSRFRTAETAELFDNHLKGALGAVLKECGDDVLGRLEERTVNRDAYVGALCLPSVKRRLRITYRSFTASFETRFLVSSVVKYAENKIRALLGAKTKLSVTGLPDDLKGPIDSYFASVRRPKTVEIKTMPRENEWEKLYEPEASGAMSYNAAADIEAASWQTTDILISAFDGPDDTEPQSPVYGSEAVRSDIDTVGEIRTAPMEDSGIKPSSDISETADIYRNFVLFALNGDRNGMTETAASAGMPTDMLAGEINSAAADVLGDILLENTDGIWTVLPDYSEEAADIASGKLSLTME